MKKWEVKITVQVSENWIDDGFDLTEWAENILNAFRSFLPYAYDSEMKLKLTIKEK